MIYNNAKKRIILYATFCVGLLTGGCTQQDFYDSGYGKNKLLPEDEYFNFNTTTEVGLSVNYNGPKYKVLIEVYGENPMKIEGNAEIKRTDIEAIFKTYTDDEGKFQGVMSNVPTYLKKVYLFTRGIGFPSCIELPVIDNSVTYEGTITSESATRAPSLRSYNYGPYPVSGGDNLYSICQWGNDGALPQDYASISWELINGYTFGNLGGIFYRVLSQNWATNHFINNNLVISSEKTNIYINPDDPSKTVKLDLVSLGNAGAFKNALGYYYYKGKGQTDVSKLKKYILFPNAKKVYPGYIFSLKFFGEDGLSAPTDFPAGYTVGWFMLSDGFANDNLNPAAQMITSNDDENQHFVSLYHKPSGAILFGIEDGMDKHTDDLKGSYFGDGDYDDFAFCIKASPSDGINGSGRPEADKDENLTLPDQTESVSGTLAFEDIWPSSGDYDMNDVVVEYTRSVTFDATNHVKEIKYVFTRREKNNNANFNNAFAFQATDAPGGKAAAENGTVNYEVATNSYLIFPNMKQVATGSTYTLIRTFGENELLKSQLKTWNPYIIVNYSPNQNNRTEVHLPKSSATSMANQSQINSKDDAYYLDRSGQFPFAIDICQTDFKAPDEGVRIDSENQYPDFAKWAESKGSTHTNWYLNYKGNR